MINKKSDDGFKDTPRIYIQGKKLIDFISKIEEIHKNDDSEIFISYSHNDSKYVMEFKVQLEAFKRIRKIKYFDDTQIKQGEKWKYEISKALSSAKVAILMISAHFFKSDFIYEKEYKAILEHEKNKGLQILWIPVRPANYEMFEISNFQAIKLKNKNLKPLSAMDINERDEIYVEAIRRIDEIFK